MTAAMLSFWRRWRRETAPLDFRGVLADPREAWHRARGGPFIFDVPAEKVRAIGFSGSDPDNPFVVTLRDYAAGRCTGYKGSALQDFYRQWQPFRGAHEGEEKDQCGPPWKEIRRRAENTAAGRLQRFEFRDIARELGVPPSEIRGHISGGPVTDAFGEVTFRRLARLYDSLARDGFRPEKSDASYPSGSCYLRGDDFRVTVGSGKHRVTVMLALGWAKIPLELGHHKSPDAIRREDVRSWPNVRSGLYTPGEALTLFDAIFEDRHPSGWSAPQCGSP
jgi:hypothetical protein